VILVPRPERQGGELRLELGVGRAFQALAFPQRVLKRVQTEARIEDFANEERTQYAD